MRVLAVDDDAVSRLIVKAMVESLGHECVVAGDGREAWELLQRSPIDVLIADREMPHLDGLQLVDLVRRELSARHMYIILATGLGSWEHARQGMLAGADDYLVKPVRADELELRLIAGERTTKLHRALERATQELRRAARCDPLTGLGNRRRLAEDLAVMSDRALRYGHRFSVALLDVDHFKAYNDLYGHPAGDEALRAVGGVLQAASRTGDGVYRYGGEEFLCVYSEQNAAGALAAVRRVQKGVAELAIAHEGCRDGVLTLSGGVAEVPSGEGDPTRYVAAADTALYEAKRKGRNRVEVASAGAVGALPVRTFG